MNASEFDDTPRTASLGLLLPPAGVTIAELVAVNWAFDVACKAAAVTAGAPVRAPRRYWC